MTVSSTCPLCGGTMGPERHACTACPQCGGQKSATALRCYACAWPGREPRQAREAAERNPIEREPIEPTRTPTRVQTRYRLYCVACGRATDVEVTAAHASRCQTCGGTMLLEPSE